jgi:hypothetical protein
VGGKRCGRAEPADVADPGEDLAGEQVPDPRAAGSGCCHWSRRHW